MKRSCIGAAERQQQHEWRQRRHSGLLRDCVIEDHKKTFPNIFDVGIGQFASHVTTEVDCESLFSEAGHLSNPRRARMKTKHYERLVVNKHRLGRIYCDNKKVLEHYMMKSREKNGWSEGDDREDKSFLETEKEIYLSKFPHNRGMFAGTDD